MKPTPVHTETVCSVCGLDWDRHGDKPTAETCVDLLRQDLDREKRRTSPPQPYPMPYPVPYPVRPYVPNPWPWRQQFPIMVTQPHTAGSAGTGLARAIHASYTGDATNLH